MTTRRHVGDAATARGLLADALRETSSAFGLLTRLPMGRGGLSRTAGADATGAVAFPLVGAVVGLVGAVPLVAVGWLQPLAALLSIAVIAVLTGALHLDGLADTADALLAPNRDRAERARKDPSVGPGGVVALLLVVGIEASTLATIGTTGGSWLAAGALVVAAVVSRTVAVAAAVTERSRVAPDGFGAWFVARVSTGVAGTAGIITLAIVAALALVTGSLPIALGSVIGAALGLVAARVVVVWRRQLDGDGLGATVELTFAAVLAAIAIVATLPPR